MANAVPKIQDRHFSGLSKVHSRTEPDALGPVMRGMLQFMAVQVATGVPGVVDNTGGLAAASRVLSLIYGVNPSTMVGSNCAAKTDIDAAIVQSNSGLKVLIAQLALLQSKIPAFGTVVNSITAAIVTPGTMPAVPVVFTGAATGLAAAAGVNSWLGTFRGNVNALVLLTNQMSIAIGTKGLLGAVSAVPMPSLETIIYPVVFTSDPTSSGPAATGTADAVLAADAVTTFKSVTAALATIAASFNAMKAAAANLSVPAVAV